MLSARREAGSVGKAWEISRDVLRYWELSSQLLPVRHNLSMTVRSTSGMVVRTCA